MYDWENQANRLGFAPVASLLGTAFIPIIIASSLWFGLNNEPEGWTVGNWRLMWGFAAFFFLSLVGMIITYVLAEKEMSRGPAARMSKGEYWTELLMGNMLLFRRRILGVVKYIPLPWFFMVRWFIPQILVVLFANLCASKDKTSGKPNFGNYGGFAPGYQAFGIGVFCMAVFALLLGVVMPSLYSCFIPVEVVDPHEVDFEKEELARRNEEVAN